MATQTYRVTGYDGAHFNLTITDPAVIADFNAWIEAGKPSGWDGRAMQWTGNNIHDLWDWAGADHIWGPDPDDPSGPKPARLCTTPTHPVEFNFLDLEVGDWIVRGAKGYVRYRFEGVNA